MHRLINKAITEILINHKELLIIPVRQKAKFEGWLKFELANYLQKIGMESVEVESKKYFKRDRTDITFFHNENLFSVELKTPNTNWKIDGVNASIRPITKNIQSVIDDAKKLNSNHGVVAFVLFPVPFADSRWEEYISRISKETNIEISRENNCNLVELEINKNKKCQLLVCTFMSRKFYDW